MALYIAISAFCESISKSMPSWGYRAIPKDGMTGKDVLQNAGKISHDRAIQKAYDEYEK